MSGIGERIRTAANEVGGLNRLSDMIAVPRRTLGNWLTGTTPKPEALRKIAEVADVSLSWLITGQGDMYPLERREREAAKERERQEFERAFSKGMSRLRLEEHEGPIIPAKGTSPQLDIALLERLARIVTEVHKEAHIKIAPEKVSVEAGHLYNELMQRVADHTDQEEIEATLPQLRHLLKRRMAEAVANPGQGKRSAS